MQQIQRMYSESLPPALLLAVVRRSRYRLFIGRLFLTSLPATWVLILERRLTLFVTCKGALSMSTASPTGSWRTVLLLERASFNQPTYHSIIQISSYYGRTPAAWCSLPVLESFADVTSEDHQ